MVRNEMAARGAGEQSLARGGGKMGRARWSSLYNQRLIFINSSSIVLAK
jgi:hypothetical protein